VAAVLGEFDLKKRVLSGDVPNLVQNVGRKKRIVDGAQEQCWNSDSVQKAE
jgi:hypothetical protein